MAVNNACSNERLLKACATLDQSAFEAPRSGFFPSIKLTLNHILTVDWFYLDALENGGRGRSVYEPEVPCATVLELHAAQRATDQRLLAYCASLEPADLSTAVDLARPGGVVLQDRVDRVVAHLFAHQIHHRGQVHAMLSDTRCPPPQLDEFLLSGDAELRRAEMHALQLHESDTWRD
jgi:uncharacterized damage-inducible protein DinB